MPPYSQNTIQSNASSILFLLAITLATGCDKTHADDTALAKTLEAIELPVGEAQTAPVVSRLVVSQEGTLYLDLGPLLAKSADESAEVVARIWSDAGEPETRRAFALGTIDKGEEALRTQLEARKSLLDKLYEEKVISNEERHAVMLTYDKRIDSSAALDASSAALSIMFSKAYIATATGAIEVATPKTCAPSKPDEDASSGGSHVQCEFCEVLGGRDTLEDRECLIPVIELTEQGAFVWTHAAELGRESCHAGFASDPTAEASAGKTRALSPHNALVLEDANTCPTIKGAKLEESVPAFLKSLEMGLKEPLCSQARIAPAEGTWDDAVGVFQRVHAMPQFDAVMLASQKSDPEDCETAYIFRQ